MSRASDEGCSYDTIVELNAEEIEPQVKGNPRHGDNREWQNSDSERFRIITSVWRRKSVEVRTCPRGCRFRDRINKMFLGSCTNGRIEDLREAAKVVKGHKVSPSIEQAIVVPGSQQVKYQAELEGLDKIFREAGFEWREAGCSMCLAMNDDVLNPGDRCASTSNRNFEGRQGKGSRTHLVSPAMAVAAAINGHFTDIRKWEYK